MAKKNIPLLKRLRTRFLRMRHTAHFDITTTARRTQCGTAMCIAGHALDLEGYKVRFRGNCIEWLTPRGRKVKDPLERARQLLGLTPRESTYVGYTDAECGVFYDFSIETPKDAAARIEQIIAEAEAN